MVIGKETRDRKTSVREPVQRAARCDYKPAQQYEMNPDSKQNLRRIGLPPAFRSVVDSWRLPSSRSRCASWNGSRRPGRFCSRPSSPVVTRTTQTQERRRQTKNRPAGTLKSGDAAVTCSRRKTQANIMPGGLGCQLREGWCLVPRVVTYIQIQSRDS